LIVKDNRNSIRKEVLHLIKFVKKTVAIPLKTTEFDILHALMSTPNKVFSRSDLIEKVKGIEFDGLDRSIDSHIKNLRHKIENDAKSPMYILTVHGTGYRFGGH
ncbi:TPA: helix-turn-helix domain-containing protein, partial [Enterococcus faecium]